MSEISAEHTSHLAHRETPRDWVPATPRPDENLPDFVSRFKPSASKPKNGSDGSGSVSVSVRVDGAFTTPRGHHEAAASTPHKPATTPGQIGRQPSGYMQGNFSLFDSAFLTPRGMREEGGDAVTGLQAERRSSTSSSVSSARKTATSFTSVIIPTDTHDLPRIMAVVEEEEAPHVPPLNLTKGGEVAHDARAAGAYEGKPMDSDKPVKANGEFSLGMLPDWDEEEETHYLDQNDKDPSLDRYVEINCGGIRFEMQLCNLQRHPETLLWELSIPGGDLYDHGYVFFDRDPMAFNYVLDFYRRDRLQMPSFMNEDTWHLELEFYQIENPAHRIPTEEEVHQVQVAMGKPDKKGKMQWLWLTLEDPGASIYSKMFATLSVTVILLGVIAFVLETHPNIRLKIPRVTYGGITAAQWASLFALIEIGVVIFFSSELFLRWLCNHRKRNFFLKVSNVIDLIAVMPFYFERFPGVASGSGANFVRVLRLVRIIRVIGLVLKLSKYSAGARVLGQTILECGNELGILSITLLIACVLFGSAFFYCENSRLDVEESEFNSIMRSTYVALITILTIGYGDYSPTTVCGEATASIAALTGIFVLGLPTSVIGVKFHDLYNQMLREMQIAEERERLREAAEKMQALRGIQKLGKVILGPRYEVGDEITNLQRAKIRKRAKAVFEEVDYDGSGAIDALEMGRAMKGLGAPMSKEALAEAINFMDEDGNGVIDEREFTTFVERMIVGDIPATMEVVHGAMVGGGVQMQSHKADSKAY